MVIKDTERDLCAIFSDRDRGIDVVICVDCKSFEVQN